MPLPAELAAPRACMESAGPHRDSITRRIVKIRDQVESLVMGLILEFRRAGKSHRA